MAELTAEENKYFDTKGAAPIPGDADVKADTKVEETADTQTEKSDTKADAKEETKAEPKAEEKPRWVDYRALSEERGKRKGLEKKLIDQDRAQSVLQARLDMLERLAKGEPKQEIPAFDDNPALHLKQGMETADQRLVRLERQEAAREQMTAHERARDEFVNTYKAQATEFSRETKDFPQAYRFLLTSRQAELTAAGIPNVGQVLEQEEGWLADQAMKQGKNPGESIYQMAKARGYKPGNGHADSANSADSSTRDPETGQFKKIEDKLGRIAEGQEKNKSLGGASGSGAGAGMTLEALLAMDGEEFNAATADPKKWKKLWGG
jgi:hypothetical protein